MLYPQIDSLNFSTATHTYFLLNKYFKKLIKQKTVCSFTASFTGNTHSHWLREQALVWCWLGNQNSNDCTWVHFWGRRCAATHNNIPRLVTELTVNQIDKIKFPLQMRCFYNHMTIVPFHCIISFLSIILIY